MLESMGRRVEMDGHNNQPSDVTALEYRSAAPECKGYLHAELLVLEGEATYRRICISWHSVGGTNMSAQIERGPD